MQVLTDLCSIPTAPFAEQRVAQFIRQFVLNRPKLKLSADRFGNLLIELPAPKSARAPRLVFTAHMDHPGFVADAMVAPNRLRAFFRGYVLSEYVQNCRVRFFDGPREIIGKVLKITEDSSDRHGVPGVVIVQVNEPVTRFSPGMFDVGAGRIKGKKFLSRVCDDLAGAAACLSMLEHLLKRPAHVPVAVLLTRAEEEGFIGAIAAATMPKLLRKTDRLVAVECSAVQPYAPQGGGAIVRVGDRTSVFNSALTYFLTAQAEALAKKDKSFKYQRALMPGGTCEATVYDLYGFTASSICLPLANYHNMDRQKKKLAPENIDTDDYCNMVKLFVRLARYAHEFDAKLPELRKKLEDRFASLRPLLKT